MHNTKITARLWQPQDLIDDLQGIIDEECDNYLNTRRTTLCMARDYLKEHFAEQEWISVKDRLPEVATTHNTRWDKSTDSIRVLCACVQADGKKMVKEGYCKVYSDGFIHWKIPGTIHSVTHWQYLPQPPKGE